jgi:hypothetical protein
VTNLVDRLADIAAEHATTVRRIDRPAPSAATAPQRPHRDRRVLLPADQQRGASPPKISAAQSAVTRRQVDSPARD